MVLESFVFFMSMFFFFAILLFLHPSQSFVHLSLPLCRLLQYFRIISSLFMFSPLTNLFSVCFLHLHCPFQPFPIIFMNFNPLHNPSPIFSLLFGVRYNRCDASISTNRFVIWAFSGPFHFLCLPLCADVFMICSLHRILFLC